MGEKPRLHEYLKNSDYSKYICQFLVIAASMGLFFVVFRFDVIRVWIKKLLKIMQPINIGLVLAYLINPIVRYWEKRFEAFAGWLNRKKKWIKNVHGFARGFSVGISLLMVVSLIVGLVLIVAPQLTNSILGLIKDMPAKMDAFNLWFQKTIEQSDFDTETITAAVYEITNYIENWFTTDFANVVNKFAGSLTSGIVSFYRHIF